MELWAGSVIGRKPVTMAAQVQAPSKSVAVQISIQLPEFGSIFPAKGSRCLRLSHLSDWPKSSNYMRSCQARPAAAWSFGLRLPYNSIVS